MYHAIVTRRNKTKIIFGTLFEKRILMVNSNILFRNYDEKINL